VGLFFGVLTQSALGNGAGYVALLLVAYDRYHSPWAISLVLMADLLPAMFFGPLLGAVADRFSRKWCVVISDILRAVAFGGIAFTGDLKTTVVLAAVAGLGNGLFRPAALAAIPSLVRPERVPAATAVFGGVDDIGFTLGPALAAGLLLVVDAETVTAFNGATFGISALVLARVPFGARPAADVTPAPGRLMPSLLRETREGMRAAAAERGLRVVMISSAVTLLFCGVFNVAELLFAQDELDAGASGFSVLAALFGFGFLGGSLAGARGGTTARLKRGYLAGLVVLSTGFIGSALSPGIWAAALCFVATGFGNGLVLVHERLIIQAVISDTLAARIYGVKDALTAWAFGLAFASGGGLVEAFGVRPVLLVAGLGSAATAAGAVIALRHVWAREAGSEAAQNSLAGAATRPSDRRLRGSGDGLPRQDHPDLVAAGDRWLALLDDLHERPDHARIELGASM